MGGNWAIVIGVNEYSNLKPLNYAERDAASVRDFFGEMGFDQVYFFAKGAPKIPVGNGPGFSAEPTFGELSNFLDRRFEQAFLSPSDNLWFFFAGHGRREGQQDYLMLRDSNPRNVDRSALKIDELAATLRRSNAGNVILLLDACRDEGNRNGLGIGLKQQGVITFYACAASQQSYEIEELQSGAFTYAFLQGLKLRGEDGNCATVERLSNHLQVRVPALVRQYKNVDQNPVLALNPDNKRDAILLPKLARSGDVQALKIHALNAEVEGDRRLARELWIQVLAASPADLGAIAAIERLAQAGQMVVNSMPIYDTVVKGPEPESQELLGSFQFETISDSESRPFYTESRSEDEHSQELLNLQFEIVKLDAKGKIIQRQIQQNLWFWQDLGSSEPLTMMQIPAGKFLMGSPYSEKGRYNSESPQHEVSVLEFYMSQTSITQAQWRSVCKLQKVNIDLNENPSNFKGDKRPVEQVNWWEAQEFCDRLSKHTGITYRLPSEAEWEYACRSKTTTPFYFGETIAVDVANYDGNSIYENGVKGKYRKQTTDVASFPANGWGLYDMHGNVWEWCADHWHDNYQNASANGSIWLGDRKDSRRPLRGGSWNQISHNCRSAHRRRNGPSLSRNSVGFRVVCRLAS